MNRTITSVEINRRAEILLAALELLYAEPDRTMLTIDFTDLLKGVPSIPTIMTSLTKNSLTKPISRGKERGLTEYIGLSPNIVISRKIVEFAVQSNRSFHSKRKAVTISNKVQTAQEVAEIRVKPAPLQYNLFLKELAVLKERYKMTVPNAEIEIVVKVSSLANV